MLSQFVDAVQMMKYRSHKSTMMVTARCVMDGDSKGDGNTRRRAMKSMILAIARRVTKMKMIESQRAKTLTMTIVGQQIMYLINPDPCAVNNSKGFYRGMYKLHTSNW